MITPTRPKVKIGIIILALFLILGPLFSIFTKAEEPITNKPQTNIVYSNPYVGHVPADDSLSKVNVTIYDPNLAYDGLNIFTPESTPKAFIMDMSGEILHTWILEEDDGSTWSLAELDDNGDLLSFALNESIAKYNLQSRVKWEAKLRAHHDICEAKNGDIYGLTQEDGILIYAGIPIPVLHNYLVILSSEGKLKQKIPLTDNFKDYITLSNIADIYQLMLRPIFLKNIIKVKIAYNYVLDYGTAFDIFHLNNVEIINRDIMGLCKEGDLLLCYRKLHLVSIYRPGTENFVWSWGPGEIEYPHHPTLLDNDHILIFDNGSDRGYSRIIELNPVEEIIEWEYKGDSDNVFFSHFRGSNQRLPNGNTLICESDRGRIFEVTPTGKVVWEFFSPNINEDTKEREAIYRFMRIVDPEKHIQLKRFLK